MVPKQIPIPSDVVLKVFLTDLYDSSGEKILITALPKVSLVFTSGGASKSFDVLPATIFGNGEVSEVEEGATEVSSPAVSIVNPPEGDDPYFVVCLCTKELLPGQLGLRAIASIPDARFHDGIRTEIDEYMFDIILT